MPIRHKPTSAIYKLVLGIISLVVEWFILIGEGPAALRLFPTWVLFISSIYYLGSALYLALSPRADRPPCPMLEGMIIINCLLMEGAAIAQCIASSYFPPDWLGGLVCFVLPLLPLFDWILFDQKGRWHPMAPFYWLALPVCYGATMIFTADLLPFNAQLVYPLEFLDYEHFGFFASLEWFFFIGLIVLIAGYVLFIIDFIASGKLAKAIVLPHIQVIEVDEPTIETPSEQPRPRTTTKPPRVAKPTPTKSSPSTAKSRASNRK